MAKDITLSDTPVFKKIVLGKNDTEVQKKENMHKESPKNAMPESLKNEYFEMLDKMNGEDDNLSNVDVEPEEKMAELAKILGGEEVKITPENDVHINIFDEMSGAKLETDTSLLSSDLVQEEVLKFSDSEVEIVDEKTVGDDNPPLTNGLRYKSGYAASQLGISDQLLRNYCEYFSELVEIERTQSGQRQFSKENIEDLRKIINYMKKNHYTPAQTVKAIKAEMLVQEDPVAAHELMTTKMAELADLIIERIENKNLLMLDDKLRERNTALTEKIDEMQKRQELIHEGYQKIIDVKNTQIDELIRQNKETQETIQKLIEEKNENLIANMREIMKENESQGRKKSWFPWNK